MPPIVGLYSDIDTTDSDALSQVLDIAEKHQVSFAIARLESEVRDLLKTYDLLDRIGEKKSLSHQ